MRAHVGTPALTFHLFQLGRTRALVQEAFDVVDHQSGVVQYLIDVQLVHHGQVFLDLFLVDRRVVLVGTGVRLGGLGGETRARRRQRENGHQQQSLRVLHYFRLGFQTDSVVLRHTHTHTVTDSAAESKRFDRHEIAEYGRPVQYNVTTRTRAYSYLYSHVPNFPAIVKVECVVSKR